MVEDFLLNESKKVMCMDILMLIIFNDCTNENCYSIGKISVINFIK